VTSLIVAVALGREPSRQNTTSKLGRILCGPFSLLGDTVSFKLGLRSWKTTHIEEDCSDLKGTHENSLFWNCVFKKLRGLKLIDCVLTHSKFETDDLDDAMGFTLTLGDCGSFRNVEYSETLFDLYLVMAIMTKGNVTKRRKLIEVVGRDRVQEILTKLATLER
jgi:hypothetical protein